jgi:hypothetical protein
VETTAAQDADDDDERPCDFIDLNDCAANDGANDDTGLWVDRDTSLDSADVDRPPREVGLHAATPVCDENRTPNKANTTRSFSIIIFWCYRRF